MTRKQWMLIAVAVVLGGVSLYLNKDWFTTPGIHISHRSRPTRLVFGRKKTSADDTQPILFMFDHRLKLTSLKVFPVSDIETSKYPHAIWYLVSESNSAPVKDVVYGQPVPGMKPAVKGTLPDTLTPGEKYRLVIETASLKGEHDFVPVPPTP